MGDIAKWVRKVLSMLDLVLRGLFCHSPKLLYVQSLRVHRSESSIDLGGGNIKKKVLKGNISIYTKKAECQKIDVFKLWCEGNASESFREQGDQTSQF